MQQERKNIAGWARIGGKQYYFKSRFEMRWAAYLEFLKQHGKIANWYYEPRRFYFEKIKTGTRCYTPDFKVIELDGSTTWHEAKGYLDAQSVTKIKRFAKYYPAEKLEFVIMRMPSARHLQTRVKIKSMQRFVQRIVIAGPIFSQLGKLLNCYINEIPKPEEYKK